MKFDFKNIPIASYRKNLLIIAFSALIGIGLAYASWEVIGKNVCKEYAGVCSGSSEPCWKEYMRAEYCFDFYHSAIYYGFFPTQNGGDFFPLIILSALLLLCFPERVYHVWKWFALVVIPLFISLIIFPVQESGGDLLGGKEVSSTMLGYLFVFFTLVLSSFATSRSDIRRIKPRQLIGFIIGIFAASWYLSLVTKDVGFGMLVLLLALAVLLPFVVLQPSSSKPSVKSSLLLVAAMFVFSLFLFWKVSMEVSLIVLLIQLSIVLLVAIYGFFKNRRK
jgi:hypothetical protein